MHRHEGDRQRKNGGLDHGFGRTKSEGGPRGGIGGKMMRAVEQAERLG